jgi:ATP-dependent helicase/nuclease subunit A
VPPTYVAQLALYRAAVAPLYPGKSVRALLVWTSGPTVLELPPARLDAAMAELAPAPGR